MLLQRLRRESVENPAETPFNATARDDYGVEAEAESEVDFVDSCFAGLESMRLTLSRATPFSVIPSSSAERVERSRLRPRTCGPRSLIRTFTDLPFAGLVTNTVEPIGKILDAAVNSSGSYGSPLAVGRPAACSPW